MRTWHIKASFQLPVERIKFCHRKFSLSLFSYLLHLPILFTVISKPWLSYVVVEINCRFSRADSFLTFRFYYYYTDIITNHGTGLLLLLLYYSITWYWCLSSIFQPKIVEQHWKKKKSVHLCHPSHHVTYPYPSIRPFILFCNFISDRNEDNSGNLKHSRTATDSVQ